MKSWNIFENKHHLKDNWVGYTAGLVAIGGLIAQIEIIYSRKSAGDLSYILISSRIIILSLWLWYGLKNQLPPTIFASITGLILTIILLGLKIHYDNNKDDKDDNKDENVKTKNWGSQMWTMMHTYSYLYPDNPTENNKSEAIRFYDSIEDFIKCGICKENAKEFSKNNIITVDTKDELIEWVLKFHNTVNKELGKEVWTREQLDKEYKF